MNCFAELRGKRCLVTGHTGFKGSWLSFWLCELGAQVHGLALEPATEPALFRQLDLTGMLAGDRRGDVRDSELVTDVVAQIQPDFVFHLAAQPLVRQSYAEPVETFATNVMGTVHVLEALRGLGRKCSVVVVTTDKCYENLESGQAYREDDALGGHDCYSASKASAEIVAAAYRRSFFSGSSELIRIATARAGNVIGGGDWATNRIVPDCMRHLLRGEAIPVRNRYATRPWQHVLEPLSGYLSLALHLASRTSLSPDVSLSPSATAFNFGPEPEDNRTVQELVDAILGLWPGSQTDASEPDPLHEAKKLNLATNKAKEQLRWAPRWNFARAVESTVEWYKQSAVCRNAGNFRCLTRRQIREYSA
jgi:CDP-glucose 4,6-dehydratase